MARNDLMSSGATRPRFGVGRVLGGLEVIAAG
jgi:hypothetical protein